MNNLTLSFYMPFFSVLRIDKYLLHFGVIDNAAKYFFVDFIVI